MAHKTWSFRDSRGHLCVDCSECTRGGNGSDPDKCCAGWRHKRGGKGQCFAGTPMPGVVEQVDAKQSHLRNLTDREFRAAANALKEARHRLHTFAAVNRDNSAAAGHIAVLQPVITNIDSALKALTKED